MNTDNGLKTYMKALELAAEKHQNQRRKGFQQLPYINHLIKTCRILTDCGEKEHKLLTAAALHDIVEDTDVTGEAISEEFGEDVASVVIEVTDDMSMPKAERKRLQVEKAPNLSTEAKKIKIADKICNMRDILKYPLDWTAERQLEYFLWAEKVVHGCRGVNNQLEALFDKVLQNGKKHLQTILEKE